MADRRPNADRRFSWAKLSGDERVTYRLFRRDVRRKVHMSSATFGPGDSRQVRARVLRIMRRRLLDQVDAIDLQVLGLEEIAA